MIQIILEILRHIITTYYKDDKKLQELLEEANINNASIGELFKSNFVEVDKEINNKKEE